MKIVPAISVTVVDERFQEILTGLGVPWESWVPEPFSTIILQIVAAIILGAILATIIGFELYFKRKFVADGGSRLGPNRVGPFGVVVWVADTLKLIQKEDIIHRMADKWAVKIAPIVMVTASLMAFIVIPFSKNIVFSDMDVGLLYIFAVSGISIIGLIMAGYGSNNKFATISTFRAVLQVISYEIPLIIVALTVVMVAGSLNLSTIVEAQQGSFLGFLPKWFIFTQPVAFVLYLAAMMGEVMRNPFDLPEAESEIIAGYFIEFTGFRFALLYLAELGHMLLASCVITTIFLGGWLGPAFLPGLAWFGIKAFLVLSFIFVMRMTHPRVRPDQLMQIGWKGLMELSFANLVFTAIVLAVVL